MTRVVRKPAAAPSSRPGLARPQQAWRGRRRGGRSSVLAGGRRVPGQRHGAARAVERGQRPRIPVTTGRAAGVARRGGVDLSASSAAATTSPAAAPPSAAAPPKAPVAGWVPVDPAAWKAQVDAYKALAIDPVPAGVGNLPEFRADCQYSHSLADDPIVFPGLPGASHMHSFVGNKAVSANTAPEDLTKFTATTCKPIQDHSAYWVPTLYDNGTGKPVETTGFRVYYRSLSDNSTGQMPMPNGLRMISGDATKKQPTPRGATGQFYCAFYGPGDLDGVARSTNGNWPICGGPPPCTSCCGSRTAGTARTWTAPTTRTTWRTAAATPARPATR